MPNAIPWSEIQQCREEIERLDRELKLAYSKRAQLMRVMAEAGMTTRKIAPHWNVSQPVVSYALQGGQYRDRRRQEGRPGE